jgi:hypothetical protein
MSFCDRCHAHPAEVVFGEMMVCSPCADVLAWDYGTPMEPPDEGVLEAGFHTGALSDISFPGIVLPPIGALEAMGILGPGGLMGSVPPGPGAPTAPRPGVPGRAATPGSLLPELQPPVEGRITGMGLVVVLGGVVAVGILGLMAWNAYKAADAARETIKKHPELLAAL